MISIIIPLYNKEHQIAQTLQTVFAQTYHDYEIVVVDDGSTDRSAEIVASLADNRIRLFHQENAGVSAARNKGMAEARGEFIAFLDADDEWMPDYLSTQIRLLEDFPLCDVFATNYEFQTASGTVTPTILRQLPFEEGCGIITNYFEVAANSNPPLWTSAVMVRKSALEAVGGFPVGIKSGEDLITWARLACQYQIAFSTSVQAVFIFDEQHFNADQRARRPETVDYVGDSLLELYRQHRSTIGLRNYVGLWHKMRCRIFISKHCRKGAIMEAYKALNYNQSLKYFVFFFLSLMPFGLANKIIRSFS
jgi:glycosyltransferase involved in cell wall biosynthesis